MPRTPSLAVVAVLAAIADGVRYGFEIMDRTGLASGTVYPILGRLESAGQVSAKWEAAATAQREKRPPRRYYELTPEGAALLERAAHHYRTLGGMVPEAGA